MVLFLHNTSSYPTGQIEGEKYADLLSVKGFRGFPTVAFMDAAGEVLTSNIERSVAGFKRTAETLNEIAELGKAEKEGKLDGDAAARLVLAQIDLGKMDAAAAKTRAASIKGPVSAERKKALDQRILDLDVAAIFEKHQKAAAPEMTKLQQAMRPKPDGTQPTDEERSKARAAMTERSNATQDAVAAELKALVAKNQLPSDKGARNFWYTLLKSAERSKDEAMVKRAKEELIALGTRDPAQKMAIDRMLNPPPAGSRPATPIRAVPAKASGDGDKKDGGR